MEFNTNNIRKTPINRNNLFFSDESFIFEEELASNYITQDMNQTVVLFEVDLEKTNLNQLYYESKKDGIVFKTPVELHVVYEIEEPDLKAYDSNKNYGSYLKSGKLIFDVLNTTLEEMDCEIKVGDYIGVQVTEKRMEMYTVIDDGRIPYDNKHSMYGIKPFFRTVSCVPIDSNEFNGK